MKKKKKVGLSRGSYILSPDSPKWIQKLDRPKKVLEILKKSKI